MKLKPSNILLIVVGLILVIIGIVGITQQRHSPQGKTTTVSESKYHDNQSSTQGELTNREKGNLFEEYIASCFSDTETFNLEQGKQSAATEYDSNPDFKIRQKFSDDFYVTYWLECTYRTKPDVEIKLKNSQLESYRDLQHKTHFKVMMVIGTAGTPDNPEKVFVVPLDSITGDVLSPAQLQAFRLYSPTTDLGKYMKDYFSNHIFKKKKNSM